MKEALQCPSCKNSYRSFNQCPECLIDLQMSSVQQHIDGDRNQAIIINGNNTGAINVNDSSVKADNTTYIQRTSINPLHVKSWQVGAASILSVIGSFASIASIPLSLFSSSTSLHTPPYMLAAPLLLIAGSLLFITWKQLRRDKYIKLKVLPFMVEQDSQGNLYRTRVGGTCGLCNHPVRLISYGTHTRAECTNYPQDHWWKFQSSDLPDVGDNYNDPHGN